jgi:hypothetical protein
VSWQASRDPAYRTLSLAYEEKLMFTEVQILIARVRASLERFRRDERGYSTEAVVVTAALVLLAIAVVAIIVAKVTEKANGITL